MTRPVVIETTTGGFFDFSRATDPSQINLEDIATALSNTCRFGGHVSRFYSVAEHSVRVSWWVEERVVSAIERELCLAALLHDAHEAYIGDIPTPVKVLWGEGLAVMAYDIDQAVAAKFGLNVDWLHDPDVKAGDTYMLRVEAATLKKSRGVGKHWGQVHSLPPDEGLGWSVAESHWRFLTRFEELLCR